VTFTATPTDASIFAYWIITSDADARTVTDNSLTITVAGGSTYNVQAVFNVVQPLSPVSPGNISSYLSSAAIVIVLPAAGGTTTPGPGTYALANATSLNLNATPNSGWQFSHWVISGDITSHGTSPLNLEPTDNPYNVNHGYGATYYYQPVFTQTNAPSPSPTIPELPVLAILLLIGAMIPVVIIARKHKTTKV
jgi:hypothetical protein